MSTSPFKEGRLTSLKSPSKERDFLSFPGWRKTMKNELCPQGMLSPPHAWCPTMLRIWAWKRNYFAFLPFLLLSLARGSSSSSAKIPGSVAEPKTLGHVTQVQSPDVEDGLEVGGVGGVRANEGLQGWKTRRGQ